MAHTELPATNPKLQPDNVDAGALLKSVFWLTVVTVVVHGYVWVLMGSLTNTMAEKDVINFPLALEQGERLPPEPRLQTVPKEDLAITRERDRVKLEGYSWVDKNAGTVRIPIDDAMKKVLAQGFPVRSTEPAAAATPAPEAAKPAPESGARR